jgi:hypothetical protein
MTPTKVKIKTYSVRKYGDRGFSVTLPKVWIDDTGARDGDSIDVFRDTEDRLILELSPRKQRGSRKEAAR